MASKQKKRSVWKSTFPDLYYYLKINGKDVSNSEANVKKNKILADWKISFPNQEHIKVEDTIEVVFWDQDPGFDDKIASLKFSGSELDQDLDLDRHDENYLTEKAIVNFKCEMKYKV